MIKAILFDFDGTLADTLPFYIKAYHKSLQQLGFSFTDKEIVAKCFGKKELDVCTALGIPEKTTEFSTGYFDAVRELFKDARLFEGTLPVLRQIRSQGMKIAIITFAYRWYIDIMMRQFQLEDLVDMIISADDVTKSKPDPEAVFKACSSFRCLPKECVVVGDSGSDIRMGNAAGATSILMHPDSYGLFYDISTLATTNPAHTIKKIDDLLSVI